MDLVHLSCHQSRADCDLLADWMGEMRIFGGPVSYV